MTCKHEWIKHPNNELLEMCRLCDKERTKGKESQKIPDVVLSKEDIEEKPPKTPDKSLLPKIVVGMIGVVCVWCTLFFTFTGYITTLKFIADFIK